LVDALSAMPGLARENVLPALSALGLVCWSAHQADEPGEDGDDADDERGEVPTMYDSTSVNGGNGHRAGRRTTSVAIRHYGRRTSAASVGISLDLPSSGIAIAPQ
jgi:hypothetical protein